MVFEERIMLPSKVIIFLGKMSSVLFGNQLHDIWAAVSLK